MPARPSSKGRLSIPPTYEEWLEALREHLDRPGETGELIRHLARELGISEAGSQVKVSRIVNAHRTATIDVFFIIAHWLAMRQKQTDE